MYVSPEKVSVIMPVYNTQKDYLRVAVSSVLEQTHNNMELIMIDDGSGQICADYCDALALEDERIRVIHQINAGVSVARNNGTDAASGSYIMYVDSDDILGKTAIQEGLQCLNETGASFVFAAIQHISSYSEFNNEDDKGNGIDYYLYQAKDIDKVRSAFLSLKDKDFLNINKNGFVNRGPYARLIRKDIAAKVRFNERLKIGEDVEWNMRLLNESDSVAFVKKIWYGYLISPGASLRKYYGNRAQLLEDYHTALYESNKDFCDSHLSDYVRNVAVSFYTMLKTEYLSEQNPLTERQKAREIKQLLKKKPWLLMFNKQANDSIPLQFKIIIYASKAGCSLKMLRLWDSIKRKKAEL